MSDLIKSTAEVLQFRSGGKLAPVHRIFIDSLKQLDPENDKDRIERMVTDYLDTSKKTPDERMGSVLQAEPGEELDGAQPSLAYTNFTGEQFKAYEDILANDYTQRFYSGPYKKNSDLAPFVSLMNHLAVLNPEYINLVRAAFQGQDFGGSQEALILVLKGVFNNAGKALRDFRAETDKSYLQSLADWNQRDYPVKFFYKTETATGLENYPVEVQKYFEDYNIISPNRDEKEEVASFEIAIGDLTPDEFREMYNHIVYGSNEVSDAFIALLTDSDRVNKKLAYDLRKIRTMQQAEMQDETVRLLALAQDTNSLFMNMGYHPAVLYDAEQSAFKIVEDENDRRVHHYLADRAQESIRKRNKTIAILAALPLAIGEGLAAAYGVYSLPDSPVSLEAALLAVGIEGGTNNFLLPMQDTIDTLNDMSLTVQVKTDVQPTPDTVPENETVPARILRMIKWNTYDRARAFFVDENGQYYSAGTIVLASIMGLFSALIGFGFYCIDVSAFPALLVKIFALLGLGTLSVGASIVIANLIGGCTAMLITYLMFKAIDELIKRGKFTELYASWKEVFDSPFKEMTLGEKFKFVLKIGLLVTLDIAKIFVIIIGSIGVYNLFKRFIANPVLGVIAGVVNVIIHLPFIAKALSRPANALLGFLFGPFAKLARPQTQALTDLQQAEVSPWKMKLIMSYVARSVLILFAVSNAVGQGLLQAGKNLIMAVGAGLYSFVPNSNAVVTQTAVDEVKKPIQKAVIPVLLANAADHRREEMLECIKNQDKSEDIVAQKNQFYPALEHFEPCGPVSKVSFFKIDAESCRVVATSPENCTDADLGISLGVL